MSAFEYTDPDDGILYEMRYVVTQSPDEGPEYIEWRVSPKVAGSVYMPDWQRLPPWAMPPKEAMEHWHGEMKSKALEETDGLTIDDLNDLCGALYRLVADLKRVGAIQEEFWMQIP